MWYQPPSRREFSRTSARERKCLGRVRGAGARRVFWAREKAVLDPNWLRTRSYVPRERIRVGMRENFPPPKLEADLRGIVWYLWMCFVLFYGYMNTHEQKNSIWYLRELSVLEIYFTRLIINGARSEDGEGGGLILSIGERTSSVSLHPTQSLDPSHTYWQQKDQTWQHFSFRNCKISVYYL